MPYSEVKVSFSQPKLRKLLKGEEVNVGKRDLQPLYPVPLLKSQKEKLEKFYEKAGARDSMPLKFSKNHLMYIAKEWGALESVVGSGFWSKFKRFFSKVGKGVVKGAKAVGKVALPILKAVAPVAINLVPGAREIVDTAREVGKQAGVGEEVDRGLNQVLGVGMKKPRKRKTMVGREF